MNVAAHRVIIAEAILALLFALGVVGSVSGGQTALPEDAYLVPLGSVPAASGGQATRPERVHLVPLGEVFSVSYDALLSHYRDRFGLALAVLPAVPLTLEQIDLGRSQFVAEALIARMRAAYPDLDQDPAALLIGLTEHDMYLEHRPEWRFGFALRLGSRFAVISSARMDDFNRGGEPEPALLHTRLRKMITRTLGLMYFGLPPSDDPRSVLYHSILGIEDLDAVTEDF